MSNETGGCYCKEFLGTCCSLAAKVFQRTSCHSQQSKASTANLQPLAQRREIPAREFSAEFPKRQSASSGTTSWVTTLTEDEATRSGEMFLGCYPAEQIVRRGSRVTHSPVPQPVCDFSLCLSLRICSFRYSQLCPQSLMIG